MVLGGQAGDRSRPDCCTDDANKTWAKYTPGGRIELTIDNPDAFEYFELGKSYFIDFSDAPAKEVEEQK